MTNDQFEIQINILITEKDLADKLDEMVMSDDSDRSKFVRRLIRQEWGRRAQMSLPNLSLRQAQGDASPKRKGERAAMPA